MQKRTATSPRIIPPSLIMNVGRQELSDRCICICAIETISQIPTFVIALSNNRISCQKNTITAQNITKKTENQKTYQLFPAIPTTCSQPATCSRSPCTRQTCHFRNIFELPRSQFSRNRLHLHSTSSEPCSLVKMYSPKHNPHASISLASAFEHH